MKEQEDVLAKLSDFADELDCLAFPSSPISLELASFVAGSIRDYLRGDQKSLDSAFGLSKKRGAPGNPEKRKEIAREVLLKRLDGKSWLEIANDFSMQGHDVCDDRTLRKYYYEFFNELASEELCKRLDTSGDVPDKNHTSDTGA